MHSRAEQTGGRAGRPFVLCLQLSYAIGIVSKEDVQDDPFSSHVE